MKKRLGFVSNSSSSSFILSATSENDKIKIEIDLDDLLSRMNESSHDVIKTEKQLNDYYWDRYCWVEDEYKDLSHEEQMKICFESEENDYGYADCLEEINKGKIIIVAEVENYECEMFGGMIKNSNIKIIKDEY